MAPWKYFLIGLGIGFVGAILWVVTSLIGGIGEGLGGKAPTVLWVLLYIGGITMVAGPLTFWIILPVRGYLKKRRSRSRGQGC